MVWLTVFLYIPCRAGNIIEKRVAAWTCLEMEAVLCSNTSAAIAAFRATYGLIGPQGPSGPMALGRAPCPWAGPHGLGPGPMAWGRALWPWARPHGPRSGPMALGFGPMALGLGQTTTLGLGQTKTPGGAAGPDFSNFRPGAMGSSLEPTHLSMDGLGSGAPQVSRGCRGATPHSACGGSGGAAATRCSLINNPHPGGINPPYGRPCGGFIPPRWGLPSTVSQRETTRWQPKSIPRASGASEKIMPSAGRPVHRCPSHGWPWPATASQGRPWPWPWPAKAGLGWVT